MSWRDFFEGDHSIYVNARHRLLHDELIAKAVARHIPGEHARVLDYGCGEASSAAHVAQRCAKLYLFDTSRLVRFKLEQRFADAPGVVVLDEAGFEALAPASLDMIVVVSVLQYVGEAEFERWLENFHDKLAPGGRLVLGDVVPKDLSPLEDARALLEFGWRGGFLGAALAGLVRTFFSSYRTLRNEFGLTTYDEKEMLGLLRDHRFAPERAAENIGHNQKRMTFVATRPA